MNQPDRPIDLSLVLACYNEGEHIESSVPQIIEILDATRWNYEIIFVDDLSQDSTRALILDLVARYPDHHLSHIFHEQNTGRGGAVSDGFRAAVGNIVGYIDIDLEVHPRYIPSALLAVEDGADVCIAHRIYRLQPRYFLRHILSRVYATLVRLALGLSVQDSEAGFKFARRNTALAILQHVQDTGWFWDTELILFAERLNYEIREIPCLFVRRDDKTSTVRPVADTLAYLRSIVRLRRRLRQSVPAPRMTALDRDA